MRWKLDDDKYMLESQVEFNKRLFTDLYNVFGNNWLDNFVSTANMMLDATGKPAMTPDEIDWIAKEVSRSGLLEGNDS